MTKLELVGQPVQCRFFRPGAADIELYENHERYNSAHLRKQCLDEFGEHSIIAQLTEQYRIAAAHS